LNVWHEGQRDSALLEAFEEGKQSIVGAITSGRSVRRCCLVECLLFEFEAGVKIDLSGVHRLVTENHGDHCSVDAVVQKRHCGGVTQYMR